jgi:hypothetical protein
MILYLTHKADVVKKCFNDLKQYSFDANADRQYVKICFIGGDKQRYELTIRALKGGE